MGIDGIGSSVIIALAAVLWFLYLVPTWLKRREYLATERNAVRLQQTMRILAESAEVPSVVRVEATARTVAAQQRALRKHQRTRTSFPEEVARGERLEGITGTAHRRLRRSRAMASVVLLGALVAGGFGLQVFLVNGAWVLLAASTVVAVGSVALLGQAASVSRARAELRRAVLSTPTAAPLHDHADYEMPRQTGWSPVPVPKPLYLSRGNHGSLVAEGSRTDGGSLVVEGSRTDGGSLVVEGSRSDRLETAGPDHAALLRAAAAEAEQALRAAQAEPEVTRLERPAAASVASPAATPSTPKPSRFARMGVVDSTEAAPTDLDEILRRRRAVG